MCLKCVLNMCLEIYKIDTACFLTAPRLAWKAALRKIKVKTDILPNIIMLLVVEKVIRGGIFHSIHWYAKANELITKANKKGKNKIKIKNYHILIIGM